MDNYILAYYQKIKDGSEEVGKWVGLLYDMIVSGLEEGKYFYNQQKANRAIKFIMRLWNSRRKRKATIQRDRFFCWAQMWEDVDCVSGYRI